MRNSRWMTWAFLLGGLCCLTISLTDAWAQNRRGADAPGDAPAPLDPADEAKYLKPYRYGDYQFLAGFMPDHAEYVWGEPIHYFSLILKNTGNQPLSFSEGGDYRGGRSENNQISAVDAAGKPVATPRMFNMGGLGYLQKLEPGEIYRKMLPVERRLTFSGPGVYTVTGARAFRLEKEFSDPAAHDVPTSNSFQLTILPYTPERMAAVVERLARRIRAHGEIPPRAAEYMEPVGWTVANQQAQDLATLAAIKEPAALNQLTGMARQGPLPLRAAAVKSLGGFPNTPAMGVVLAALSDPEPAMRDAAAEALGSMKSDVAVVALQAALPGAKPETAGAILRALGRTRSAQALPTLTRALDAKDARRRAAVDGLVAFGGEAAVKALVGCMGDGDLDFREYAAKQLAETMHQTIDPQWLVPVIKSREGTHTLGEAPTMLRLHCGSRGVAALIRCLDFGEPSIRSYYNWALIYEQGWCANGLKIPWINDLNRDSTPGEIAQNRRTLKSLKEWVAYHDRHGVQDTTQSVANMPWPEQEKMYGAPVDGDRVLLSVGPRVWPAGMTQLLEFRVLRDPGNSVSLDRVPDVLEVEVNGKWYRRQPPLAGPTAGVAEGHGASFNNLLLDENWKALGGGQPLRLGPGEYTVRVRLSLQPESKRTGLATSKPVTFRVLGER